MSKTPPGVVADAPAPKVEQPKSDKPKAEKAPRDPNAPRAPRVDYGFKPGATINVTDKEVKYRGKRLAAYEMVKTLDGKLVEEFAKLPLPLTGSETNRGWMRFFVRDGAIVLSGGKDPEPKPAKEPKAPEAAAAA